MTHIQSLGNTHNPGPYKLQNRSNLPFTCTTGAALNPPFSCFGDLPGRITDYLSCPSTLGICGPQNVVGSRQLSNALQPSLESSKKCPPEIPLLKTLFSDPWYRWIPQILELPSTPNLPPQYSLALLHSSSSNSASPFSRVSCGLPLISDRKITHPKVFNGLLFIFNWEQAAKQLQVS